jgi:hypothetical protein
MTSTCGGGTKCGPGWVCENTSPEGRRDEIEKENREIHGGEKEGKGRVRRDLCDACESQGREKKRFRHSMSYDEISP